MNIEYVAGFLFDKALAKVALIRKNKPAWQAGLLNGIGGKIEEDDETPLDAMVREFREESGVTQLDWSYFAKLSGPDWCVHFFAARGPVMVCKSMTDEKVEIIPVTSFQPHSNGIIENLPWLISLAVDHLTDGRPVFVEARYP
jgi:8-oxo-dGTP diphosphatase